MAASWSSGATVTRPPTRWGWLAGHGYSHPVSPPATRTYWDSSLGSLPRSVHEQVVNDHAIQGAYLDALHIYGPGIVSRTPSVQGEVERFAETIGLVRETAFERIHNVRHDPDGCNVAHTSFELKPHTDLPSYHWPPTIQLLHFLVNEASGGESTLVDGWAVLADLRRKDPRAFESLCRASVSYQLFSGEEDTRATAPMVELDTAGSVRTFR
jgi:gamma-butyrobetaine dioxygenase